LKTLVVIPAYNEEGTIQEVIKRTWGELPSADIVIVNDGSSDDTPQLAEQTGATVLNLPCNIGYGGALQTGFRFAAQRRYDVVVTIDGDGQHDPSFARPLIETMKAERADVVIGSRFLGGQYKIGLARKLAIRVFSRIVTLYTGTTFTDPTSGFQALNRRAFSYLALRDNYPLDYPDVNIIMALHRMKFKVVEAPVRMVENSRGKSMHSGLKPVFYVIRMSLAILMVLLKRV
jgi:glycosyltransferase involved in cell wall biosynthesis